MLKGSGEIFSNKDMQGFLVSKQGNLKEVIMNKFLEYHDQNYLYLSCMMIEKK